MRRAAAGDRVTVHYIGTLDNGRLFDNADDDSPLTFTIGGGEVFPALEREVTGMLPGEVKNFTLSAEEAYGERTTENILTVARSTFTGERDVRIGQKLGICFADGTERVMRVTEITEEELTLDGNHPLAGLELTFALKLVAIA